MTLCLLLAALYIWVLLCWIHSDNYYIFLLDFSHSVLLWGRRVFMKKEKEAWIFYLLQAEEGGMPGPGGGGINRSIALDVLLEPFMVFWHFWGQGAGATGTIPSTLSWVDPEGSGNCGFCPLHSLENVGSSWGHPRQFKLLHRYGTGNIISGQRFISFNSLSVFLIVSLRKTPFGVTGQTSLTLAHLLFNS